MRNEGLGAWPERRRVISPKRDAVWFEDTTVSHAAFAERVRRVAGALAGLGVSTGDRVAWVSGNHPSALETLFACGQLGAIWVPLNARLTAPEAEYVLAHSGTSVVVHGRDHGRLADALRERLPAVRHWIAAEPPNGGGAESLPYEQLLADADPSPRDVAVGLEDPCLIMYTSGTTGKPKGAVLTHGNITWNAINQTLGYGINAEDRTLAVAPLFHIGGLNGTVTPTLMCGGCAVLVRRFDPVDTLRVIEQQRVNSFFAVPTMLNDMARTEDFHTRDLTALRTIGAAGASVPMHTLRTWLDRGVAMQQSYGMTEAAPGCTVLDSADAERKIGSAGKRVFFTDVAVLRPDGEPAGADEVGEIVVRGPNVMAGYWNDPDRTAAVFVDGWYRTGDAGSVDIEGYLYIRDRYKDMIISGGENVYPAEVESALLDLPEVAEAAVVGVPHEKWGEVGLAVLVPAPGVELDAGTVRARLRERLAGFKIPHYFRVVEQLPKTATGKVRKPDLRTQYGKEIP